MEQNIEARLVAIEAKLTTIGETTAKIRKTQKVSAYVRYGYWIFIILLALGAFYFLQPAIEQLKSVYGSFGGNEQQLDSLFDQFKNDF
ncbi:hypothetical protein IT401_01075 [Candidatus Nomurabacteria bacterium]|nr:hypothetical protein [Candidatus Nomurabacteria bacterium]